MKTYDKLPAGVQKASQKGIRFIQHIRHIRPIWWLVLVAAALGVLVPVIPQRFWRVLRSGMEAHKVLLTMLIIFGFLALSLVWTAGQRIDAYVFTYFNVLGKRRPWLDRVMMLVTELGNGIVTVGIALILYFAVNHLLAYEFILGTLTLG